MWSAFLIYLSVDFCCNFMLWCNQCLRSVNLTCFLWLCTTDTLSYLNNVLVYYFIDKWCIFLSQILTCYFVCFYCLIVTYIPPILLMYTFFLMTTCCFFVVSNPQLMAACDIVTISHKYCFVFLCHLLNRGLCNTSSFKSTTCLFFV